MRWLAGALEVRDLQRTLAYYEGVLGFSRWFAWPEGDAPRAAGVVLGPVRFIFDHAPEAVDRAPKLGAGVSFYIDVGDDDLDAYHGRVVARGANVTAPPTDQPWGDRTFTVRDPDGYQLTFARTAG